jgi:O-antigen ligase
VRRSRTELVALAAAVAVMGAGLFVTYSRSSALMLMTGLVLLGARAVGPRRAAVAGAALLIVLGGASVAASDNIRRALTSVERLERVSEGRFDLMRGGLTIWRDEPVLGAGLGGFERRFEDTLTPVEQRRIRVVISHNTPVTVLSETGVVGFALFLALLGGAGWAMVRGSRDQGEDGWARWTMGAIAAGIVVHSLLYSALFEDPFTWVLAGGAAALGARRADPVPESRPEASEAVAVP